MVKTISFCLMASLKLLSSILFRFEVKWLNQTNPVDWSNIRLIVLLNHTSLFEPIFIRLAPHRFIWRLSRHLTAPAADITLNRPFLGRFIRTLFPGLIPISRKRDASWQSFLTQIKPDSIIGILPEGRMKRKDGLDKFGKPMSVRGGIADILENLDAGDLLFVYSGGLHHIQSPGEAFPRIFRRVRVDLETLTIEQYKRSVTDSNGNILASALTEDLNHRLATLLPNNQH